MKAWAVFGSIFNGRVKMTTGVLHIPMTAFSAYGAGLGVSAHNLANVLTPGFRAGRASYAELPARSGVAASISQPERLPAAPAPVGAPSNTDVAGEMVNLITASRTYQANAKIVGVADSMLGMVIDMSV